MIRLRTGGERLSRKLIELIEKHDNIAFAVAWANHKNEAYIALIRNKKKISYAVIGTHFYQTHPDVLKCFIDCNKVRFVLQPQGIFHPKAYLFWSKKSWDMLVGSANLTSGALGENEELMLHISDSTRSDVQMDLKRQIKKYWESAKVVTAESESTYRKLWGERQPDLKCISGPSAKSESTYRKPRKKRQSSLWRPLSKSVKTGSRQNPAPHPVEVRFPDDSVVQTKTESGKLESWRGLLFQVTQWLVNGKYLKPCHCPIEEGGKSTYALVSTKRDDLRKTKKPGDVVQVGRFYLYLNLGSFRIVEATRRIIRKVGQDPAQFKVRFSPPRT